VEIVTGEVESEDDDNEDVGCSLMVDDEAVVNDEELVKGSELEGLSNDGTGVYKGVVVDIEVVSIELGVGNGEGLGILVKDGKTVVVEEGVACTCGDAVGVK